MSKFLNKTFLSTSLALSFLVVTITGIIMLFHIRGGAIKGIHQMIGLVFIISALFHLAANWRIFKSYLTRAKRTIIIAAGVILALVLLIGLIDKGHGPREGDRYIERGRLERHWNH